MTDFSFLPEVIQDLEQIIGLPSALKLVEAYGGVRLYVPKHVDETHSLSKLIGHSQAEKLVQVYAGDWIVMPRCEVILRKKRNAELFKMRAQGASARDLALAFALTERYVWSLLADGPAGDDKQLLLFK